MPSVENCTACRFHKEIDQGTQNALAFCPPKVSDAVSLTAYLLYQTVFHLSRTFSKLFSRFLKQIFQNSNFLTAVSFETAYLLYQTEIRLSRTFFILFKPLFSLTAVPLSDSFNRIPQQSPSCQQKFSGFFIFRFLPHVQAFPAYDSSPTRTLSPFADWVL